MYTLVLALLVSCGKDKGQEFNPPAPGDAFFYYNDFLSAEVPQIPLQQALAFYEDNQDAIVNKRYISIADYTQSSKEKRFYLLDMQTGEVTREQVSHGSGKVDGVAYGDLDHDGYLDRCVHYVDSARHPRENMTRPGFMLTSYTYRSFKGWPDIGIRDHNAMKLTSLEARNEDVFRNGVVYHEADYNTGGGRIMGRSYGCPAFVPGKGAPLIKKIKDGSLYYSYAPQCD